MSNDSSLLSGRDMGEIFLTVADYMYRPDVALITSIACGGIAIGALVGIWVIRRRRAGAKCKWKKDAKHDGGMTRWICSACTGVSFADGDQQPRTCRAFDPRAKSL